MGHKTSSFIADDLLLYVSDSLASIPRILTLLNSFGRLKGCKLNISKREYIPINQSPVAISPSTVPFKIANTEFKYLGITVAQSLRTMQEQNLTSLTRAVKSDLQRWNYVVLGAVGYKL